MDKISFENFTVNIDTSGDLYYSTNNLFQILFNNVENKLYIINYSSVNIEKIINDSKLRDKPSLLIDEANFQEKIVLINDMAKSITSIETYANNLTKDDYLLIIGGERLLNSSETKPIIRTNYFDLNPQVHLMEDEDWKKFAEEIDELYRKMQNRLKGIFINISADRGSYEVVFKELESSNNMLITYAELSGKNEEYEKLQKEIFCKFKDSSLKEILTIIESYKSRLDNFIYNYMIAMAYLQHGDISTTIDILKDNYNNLRNEGKLMLADLLSASGKKEAAREVLKELFEKDKYQNGLMPSILRLHSDSDSVEQKKWIDIALEIDPLNSGVLEFYGSWLSRSKKYVEAAKVFRQLRGALNSTYYELIAMINDLYNAPPRPDLADAYIYNIIKDNPELKNEAKCRLAWLFINTEENYKAAYSALNSADFELGKPRIVEIAKLKLDILSDTFKGSKALGKKPYNNLNDAIVLSNERTRKLIECIPILASTSNGYQYWRSFIEACQTDSSWKNNIFEILKKNLIELSKIDFGVELEKSEIDKMEKNYDANSKQHRGLMALRGIKAGEIPIDKDSKGLKNFVDGSISFAETYGDNKYRLWFRYYLSVTTSLKGEHQLANNLALSILEYYPRVNQEEKLFCIYLGLIAWGNSQYRIGREVEGVACIISAIKLAEKLEEFYPLVEDGINIVVRFISDNKKLIPQKSIQDLNIFYDSLKKYSMTLDETWHFINDSSGDIIVELEEYVKNSNERDAIWAGKLSNLISAHYNNKTKNRAIELIDIYGDEAIEKLSDRMDIRFHTIFNWAQIYFSKATNINAYKKILKFLDIAINDIEQRRKVYHQEERASIGEASDEVYRFYLQICSIMYLFEEFDHFEKEEILKRIENILPRVSPRSIIEQKKYNVNKEITPEAEELHEKLIKITEEYNNLYKKNSHNSELLYNKVEEIQRITEELKNKHPHYMQLDFFEEIKFQDIQNSLVDGEVFYQYVVTRLAVITLLISKNTLRFIPKLIKPQKMTIQKLAENFGLMIQESYRDEGNELDNIVIELSKAVADDLINYVSANKTKRVYVMQDYKMGLFPITISSIDNVCLIDNVESIINIIDYKAIGQRKNYEVNEYKVANRIFGNQNDTSLKKINHSFKGKKNQSFLVMENKSDNVKELREFSTNNNINTMVIYGHGAHDPKASPIDGAQGVAGQNKLIRLEEILDNLPDIKNFILISCSCGSPYSNSAENSYGSWANIFEKFCGNIISCKWDVPTDSSIFIINEMFELMKEKELPIDEALIIAQRKVKTRYNKPMFWAGLEFWVN
jgi:hypothetical protein